MSPPNRPRNVAVTIGCAATVLTLIIWLVLRHRSGALDPIGVGVLLAGGTFLSATLGLAVYYAMRSSIEAQRHATTIQLKEAVEGALRENESKLRALVEGAPDAIMSVDARGKIVMVNAVTEEMFGYPREDLLGHPIEILVPENLRATHVAKRDEYFATPRTRAMGIGMTLAGRRADGSEFPVEISLSPIPSGDALNVMCVVRDVTERKEAERRASTMLRALATIGESATVLAHEIKNPLSAVNAALKALAAKLGLEDQEVLQDLVDRMRRVESMIRRTLSFAKPIDVRRTTCLARDLVTHALADLRAIPMHRIEITTKVTPGDLRLEVDPQLIREVVSNLVANAAEAMPSGGSIIVSLEAAADRTVTLEVCDDGPGMPDVVRDRPIQPFVTTKPQGTGLGLSICRKIAEAHGGTLEIKGRRPRGTVVRLVLPASASR